MLSWGPSDISPPIEQAPKRGHCDERWREVSRVFEAGRRRLGSGRVATVMSDGERFRECLKRVAVGLVPDGWRL
jgi:hypothetical protein